MQDTADRISPARQPPPHVPVVFKRDWDLGRVFLATRPCSYCGQERHRWAIPPRQSPDLTLGTHSPPAAHWST